MNIPTEIHPTDATSYKLLCSAEWHIARLKAKYAAPLYSYAFHLTATNQSKDKNQQRLSLSIGQLAEYFGGHKNYIGKAIKELVRAGFFIELRAEPGRPCAYRPVPHKEWATKHPGCCLKKVEMPWDSEEKDPLVGRLYAASDGRLTLYANFLKGMRNTGHGDDAILAHWNAFYAENNPLPKSGVYGRFMAHLREQPVAEIE